jgi:hypothetical protein
MALNLQVLDGIVKVYGAPLYPAEPTTEAGQVQPSEYVLMEDGRTIQVTENGNTYYFPIRRAVIEAGFGEDKVFTIGLFTALRDADGTTEDGKSWSVKKGDVKAFAF